MDTAPVKKIDEIVNKLSLKQIQNLSDEEILALASPRPGHPGHTGFIMDPEQIRSNKDYAEKMAALMNRLRKAYGK